MVSSVRVCDCDGVTTDRTGITLIDGVIPVFDVSQPNWAAQLYTATSTQSILRIEFGFPDSFMLSQVDSYLFVCKVKGIPNRGLLFISVYQSLLFPNCLSRLFLGNRTLTLERQNCNHLVRISIPTNSTSLYMNYLIEFSMDNVLGGVYIGEVSFSDDVTTVASSKLLKSCNM